MPGDNDTDNGTGDASNFATVGWKPDNAVPASKTALVDKDSYVMGKEVTVFEPSDGSGLAWYTSAGSPVNLRYVLCDMTWKKAQDKAHERPDDQTAMGGARCLWTTGHPHEYNQNAEQYLSDAPQCSMTHITGERYEETATCTIGGHSMTGRFMRGNTRAEQFPIDDCRMVTKIDAYTITKYRGRNCHDGIRYEFPLDKDHLLIRGFAPWAAPQATNGLPGPYP